MLGGGALAAYGTEFIKKRVTYDIARVLV